MSAQTEAYTSHIIKPTASTCRSVLLKGPSGSGKSFQYRRLTCDEKTTPPTPRLNGLYLAVDEHLETVKDLLSTTGYWPLKQLDIPLMPSEKNPAKQDFVKLADYIRSGDHPYDFIFFDSLMNYADELEHRLKYTARLTGYDLWGVFGEKMKRLLKMLVSLTDPALPKPVHVIATWGVEISQDWEGQRSKEPIVSGKMVGPRVSYFFDDVLMLAKRETSDGVKYLAYTGGTHEFDAKISSGINKLPQIIEDPDLYRIILKAQGKL